MKSRLSFLVLPVIFLLGVGSGRALAQFIPDNVQSGVVDEKIRREDTEERRKKDREKPIPPILKEPDVDGEFPEQELAAPDESSTEHEAESPQSLLSLLSTWIGLDSPEAYAQKEQQEEVPPSAGQEPEEGVPPGEEVKTLVREIRVTGNTVVSDREIRAIVAPYEGQTLSLSDLKGIAAKITELYRKRGYFTSRAYVPPQDVLAGVVEIRLFEGKLGDITVEGTRHFKPNLVSEKIFTQTGEVLQFEKVETDLRRANRHPDKTVQGVLRKGAAPGTTDLLLKVKERFPQHIPMSWDNQGTRLIGRNRFGIGYTNTNLLGVDDQVRSRVFLGGKLRAVGLDYQMPFTRSGTALDLGFSHAEVKPQKEFEDLEVSGLSTTYSVGFIQPFYWPKGRQAELELGYDHRETVTKLDGNETNRDELRIVKTGGNFRVRDKQGVTVVTSAFRMGIPHLFGGAAVKEERFSRPSAGGRFFKWSGGLLRVQKLPLKTTAVVSVQSQVTAHKLAPSERFYLGGATTVRGYPEGEFLADHALLGVGEFLVPAFFVPEKLRMPFTKSSLKDDLQLVYFTDIGKGWSKETTAGTQDNRDLMGVGGGLRLRVFGNTYARFEWGVPVGDKRSDKNNYAFHFSISSELF